ncbi:MAG TPA: glutathione S-transferase family protein [Candidatus Binatia bacterium]|nr:glutathione S-transferase family protein [Candidatus Binatia bacterium]
MADLTLIELYISPWSERLRWVLDLKGVPYARREYVPLAGEAELERTTGLRTAPVLLADGEVVGDSNVAVDWLETRYPEPRLVPAEPPARAAVRAFELAATETMAPAARLVAIGRWRAANVQPLADHFAAKYRWSPAAEAEATRLLTTFLADLALAAAGRPYLVGDGLTRADLTVAAMLAAPLGLPPDELFAADESLRRILGLPVAKSAAMAPLRAWRDELYRRHRGRRVTPAA